MGLEIKLEDKKQGVLEAVLKGAIDTDTYTRLDELNPKIDAPDVSAVVLNLRDVDYITSMGISAIIKMRKRMQRKDGTLALVNLQPKIKEVFDSVKVIPEYIFENMKEADEYLDDFLKNLQSKKKAQDNGPGN
jgi:anti-anti-sigma factor